MTVATTAVVAAAIASVVRSVVPIEAAGVVDRGATAESRGPAGSGAAIEGNSDCIRGGCVRNLDAT